jgi:hypothetical protein
MENEWVLELKVFQSNIDVYLTLTRSSWDKAFIAYSNLLGLMQ